MIAASAALLLGLSACGGSGDDNTSSDKDSKGPVTVMQIAPIESAVYSAVEMVPSAQSAVDRVNAAGGINGHQITLISCNDKYDPNEALRCAKKAVQQEVVAVVGSLSAFGDQTAPILATKNIPTIGSNGLVPSDYTSPDSYLLDPGIKAYTGSPLVLKEFAKVNKIATLQVENPSSGVVEEYFTAGAKKSGVSIVKSILIPNDAIDWVSYVRQAESAGAEGIVTSLNPEGTLKLWSALKSADLVDALPITITASSIGQPIIDEADPSSITNTYGVSEVPLLNTTATYTADYLADMKKIAPDVVPSSTGMRAWMSVQFFADVAKGIDGDITADSVHKALDSVQNKDFMWIEGVSLDQPGPSADAPRMFVGTVRATKITDGAHTELGTVSPF